MRRALNFAFVIVLAFAAAAAADIRAATPTGRIAFSGSIVDADTPFPPGALVTVHATVIAQSESCVETRVDRGRPGPAVLLWLCRHDAHDANPPLEVGTSIAARARITGVKATPGGQAPFSDSFVLLRAD